VDNAHQLDGLLRHVIDDHEVYFADIESFLADGRRHEDVEFAFLELIDRLLNSAPFHH
jgi:hypothetical protein